MTQTYLPIKKENAGSLVGVSYMGEYIKCPRKWFYRYYQPTSTEDGTAVNTGIEPHGTAPALITGSLFHDALAAWYASGCIDGEDTGAYDLEAAIAELDKSWTARHSQYRDETAADEDKNMIKEMLISYADHFGPEGSAPDYPGMKIYCDALGEPVIEREYATPLGYGDYFLTCKVDAIIEDRGYLKVFEHKTTVASFMMQRLSSIHHDAQFTGEIYTLKNHFEGDLHGVKVNAVQKRRKLKSKYPIAERDTTNRTDDQLADFANTCVDTLMQIDDRVKNYEKWVADEVPQTEALSVWFPAQGAFNGECEAYRRPCDYYMMCKAPKRAHTMLGGYKARVTIKKDEESTNVQD